MKTTYQAVCATCYTCVVATGSKRDCERAATSHINAYGHNVSIVIRPRAIPVAALRQFNNRHED